MAMHWSGLTVFVEHAQAPMDNNVAERDARLAVVGRKNFYGSGSQGSGQLAATMYSLLMTIYSGREFSPQEIEQVRQLMQRYPTLLRMQADGLITLPASRMPHRGRPHFPATAATDAQAPMLRPVHELARLTLQPVLGTPASRLWNEYVQRYH